MSIADKCSMVVIALLRIEAMRLSELQAAMDATTRRCLADTLEKLQRYGLICRSQTPESPHAPYELTALGTSLPSHVAALEEWTARNRNELLLACDIYDAAHTAAS